MDEEERAERSENAQKYAFSMANAIDTGLGFSNLWIFHINDIVALLPQLPMDSRGQFD